MRPLHSVESEPAMYDLAQQFFTDGMGELGKAIYDESDAKNALLMGLAARGAVLLAGSPGGAKSLLGRNSYRLIDGLSEANMSIIPPDSSLQPVQLVGGRMNIDKVVSDGNTSHVETTTTNVKGLIQSNTSIIFVDEGTRVNPWAMNSLLSAAEEKELKTTAGNLPLEDLNIMITTMNASENRETTFRLSAAMASRQDVGAIMGGDLQDSNAENLVQGNKLNPSKMEAIISQPELKRLQQAPNNLLLPEDQAKRVVRLVQTAKLELLDNYGIKEENRIFGQVGKNAKIHAMFRGRKATAEDVETALRFTIAARIGALVAKKDLVAELNKFHQSVLSKSA